MKTILNSLTFGRGPNIPIYSITDRIERLSNAKGKTDHDVSLNILYVLAASRSNPIAFPRLFGINNVYSYIQGDFMQAKGIAALYWQESLIN